MKLEKAYDVDPTGRSTLATLIETEIQEYVAWITLILRHEWRHTLLMTVC